MTTYTDEEITKAMQDMLKDEKASDAFWDDFLKVVTKHTLTWLEIKQSQMNYGTVTTSKGISKLLCPVCNYLNTMDSNYCTQCSNQLRNTWLEMTRKKNLDIIR